MEHEDRRRLFEEPLTDDAVIAILTSDLPHMTEAQLAELLMNIFIDGPSVVGDAIAPLARVELSRRRLNAHVEGIVAAA